MKTLQQILMCIIVFTSIFAQKSSAQSPNWQWVKSAGGSENDDGVDVATDAAGNVYITGSFWSSTITFGTTTLKNSGSTDMYIVKYDASGNVVWATSVGGQLEVTGRKIAIDNNGNVLVTGLFSSSFAFGKTPPLYTNGGREIFVAKYNPDGEVLWAKSLGGSEDDYVNGMTVDKEGNIFLTGTFLGSFLKIDTLTLNNPGGMFIAKFDENGKVVWGKTTGNTSSNIHGTSIASFKNNIYVLGYYSGSITFDTTTLNNPTESDILIVKYDGDGNFQWVRTAGGPGYMNGLDITADRSGNIFITGYFGADSVNFGTISLTSTGIESDFFIAKYNANGEVIWAKSAGGSQVELGTDITNDSTGNVYVTGYFVSSSLSFGSISLTNQSNSGNSDLFIVKYDSLGEVIWAESIGGTFAELGSSIVSDDNGNIYLTGFFGSSSVAFGSFSIKNTTNSGIADMFVAKFKAFPTSVHWDEKSDLVSISPNPTSGQFHISIPEAGNYSITIYSLDGEKIYESFLKESQTIDLSVKAKGTYVYQLLKDDDVFKTGKFVLE